MGYRTLRECVDDLARTGQLIRIEQEIDPHLEAAAIHRRVYQAGGPAVLFSRLKNCRFPAVSNLYGTMDRVRYLFRDTLAGVETLIRLKADPGAALSSLRGLLTAGRAAWNARPKLVRGGDVLKNETLLDQLPPITCWPRDGGPFVLLPQVYTERPGHPGWRHSNLGMYRIQLAGNQYRKNREIGLHYQIHRGIGVHQAAAQLHGEPLRVNVFVGGPPALAVAAVMPLPEGMPEVAFAGVLAGHRLPLIRQESGPLICASADFCISGVIAQDRLLPEGPFGDHLGYYSLVHDFPVLEVDRVWCRDDAIWPFTVVGRPPQEDTCFGQFIHELTGAVIPSVLPGVSAVHAVDAAGVHPLLFAIGSERYTPYAPSERPAELLTQANAILGQGQLSLAKYLWIAARQDNPLLDIHNEPAFLQHMLERVDWRRDLHFQTCTTIDTLDYSGSGLNEGSKVVIAAVGPRRRELAAVSPKNWSLPSGFAHPRLCLPGIVAVRGPSRLENSALSGASDGAADLAPLLEMLAHIEERDTYPLVVVVDDADFVAQSPGNFLWVTFTRSDPAADIHGAQACVAQKHWGCAGPLVIDARRKPHHAPPLEEDPEVERRVDALAAPGGPLHGIV